MTDLETVDASSVVDLFIDLFQGRTDAYGTWEGGSVKYDGWSINTPLALHLQQGPYIGVYPLCDDNTVRWGCVDLDGKDFASDRAAGFSETLPDWTRMWDIAATLQDTLAYKDVTSWIERTAHGIHVWVFAEKPLQASVMRNALLVACEVAEYKPKEVNPKQTHVSAEKPLGNYVRLPYPGALGEYASNGIPPDRFVVDEDGRALTVQEFSRLATASRTPVETLQAMAALYTEARTATPSVELDLATEGQFNLLRPILPPVVAMMFDDGPKGDRSAALVRAAVILKDDGWLAQSTFTVLRALDRMVLRKFADRPDPDSPLLDIVERYGT